VRIHTLAGADRSAASNEIAVHVGVPVPPSAPANLLATVAGDSLTLAWTNTFGGAAPTGLVVDVSGAVSGSLPIGVSDTFAVAGIPAGTYTLSLRAVNGAGVSPSSNAVTVTFPGACSGAPARKVTCRLSAWQTAQTTSPGADLWAALRGWGAGMAMLRLKLGRVAPNPKGDVELIRRAADKPSCPAAISSPT